MLQFAVVLVIGILLRLPGLGDALDHDEAYTWGWFGEFAHFVDVLAGDAQPMLTGQDGLEVLGIVAGAYVSAAENRIVTPPWPTGPDIISRPWLDR